ncbi:hypothetical protein NXY56_003243 [Leishmania guyanensis]|uniref:Uncharacterized protein n=1 Tax=Leishmania guyanensis TaxID=5670 RepID=A0A1E1IX93_LEIGU|nr:hypothetical protein, unknown function [Leishmania guyanensis]
MKVTPKRFRTGCNSLIEDNEAMLSLNTTIAELKGLTQILFGFSANAPLLMLDHLLENTRALCATSALWVSDLTRS